MTVMLELPPEIEAGLRAQAEAEGVGVSDFLQKLVSDRIAPGFRAEVGRPAHHLPAEEWVREFRTWAASHSGNSVVLSDEAMEREAIYGDRGH